MMNDLRRVIAGARDAIRTRARGVWTRDRASLRGGRAVAVRAARIVVFAVRGISTHQLGFQAAALTYYTVFSLVPLLVVVLWLFKAFGGLSIQHPEMHLAADVTKGNAALHSIVAKLLEGVDRTGARTTGIVGLVLLLYAIVRLFVHTERALDLIASSAKRRVKMSRMFGYLGLLLLAPLLVGVVGLLTGAAHHLLGRHLARLIGAFPRLKLVLASAVGLSGLWLGIAVFYSAAARARIAFASAMVGGFAAAVLLAAVLWAFTEFQIGMSHANSVQFGAAAGPVFLLWTFSSWFVVLLGAEISVAYGVDRILIHGVWAFRLDGVGEQETAVEIMKRATRAARVGAGGVSVDGLARELRLAPQLVRIIALRLVDRRLLQELGPDRLALACDPERTDVAQVMDAVLRDPALDLQRNQEAMAMPTSAAPSQKLSLAIQGDHQLSPGTSNAQSARGDRRTHR
jgi:membrane protein